VQHLDFVNDTTLVDVRYRITRKPPTEAHFRNAEKAEREELVVTR
jgi:hypothetical protein